MKNRFIDLKTLFGSAGLKTRGQVEMNENTYDFDEKGPKDSWLYAVFLGMLELKKQNFSAKSFATIGTGSGIDSIGVYEIFKPNNIYQIDIHPNIPEFAHKNATSIIGSGAQVETFLGDLCQPLIDRNIKVDLVYANIPNIPSSEAITDKKVTASKFQERDLEDCPEELKKWYLSLQYLFLKQAKQVLNPGGVIVNAVGARVPYPVLMDLYNACNYQVTELAAVYKIQSEPEDTLAGYAEEESKLGIEFDFYDHEKAWAVWQKDFEQKKLTTEEIKQALLPFRITATQALKNFEISGKQAGHVATIFKSII